MSEQQSRSLTWSLVALPLLALTGCVSDFAPDLGPPMGNQCRDRDSDPDSDVEFATDILDGVFRSSGMCLPCHDAKAAQPDGYLDSGLDLSGHSKLMAGGANSAGDIVIPGQPCSSWLFLKLGAGPPSGSRMPLKMPPLAPDQLMLIHDWISEGAKDN